jgi:hypothetical protein
MFSNYYKLIAGVLGIICLFVGFGLGMYQWGASSAREEQAIKDRDIIIQYAEVIKKGIIQHDKDQVAVTRMSRKLSELQNIHIPLTCGSTADRSGGSELFSKRVDEAFNNLRKGGNLLFSKCDQLNIDAIRSNHAINSP